MRVHSHACVYRYASRARAVRIMPTANRVHVAGVVEAEVLRLESQAWQVATLQQQQVAILERRGWGVNVCVSVLRSYSVATERGKDGEERMMCVCVCLWFGDCA